LMSSSVSGPSEPKFYSLEKMRELVNIIGEKNKISPAEKIEDRDTVKLLGARREKEKLDVILVPGPKLIKKGPVPDLKEELISRGVEVKKELNSINGFAGKVDEKTASNLQEEGYIIYDDKPRDLLPGIPGIPHTSDNGNSWEMPKVDPVKMTRTDDIHRQGYNGKGQVIAVIDSGFDYSGIELVAWQDEVAGSKKPIDPVGHGTHVAGDALATAPGARIVAIRVMNDKGQGRPSDIIAGIEWAIKNKEKYGIGILNLSLGSGPDGIPYNRDPLCKAVEKAESAGIDVVVAAGNSGPNKRTLGSPAEDPNVITVGSARDQNTVSTFSSRGPTDAGDHKPDIIAPGEFILSWNVPGSLIDKTAKFVESIRKMSPSEIVVLLKKNPQLIKNLDLPKDILSRPPEEIERLVKSSLPPLYQPDPHHVAGPGTSFASPTVAGIVANLRQANPNLSPAERKNVIMKTADNMGNYDIDTQGAGFINAQKALANIGKAIREARG